MSAGAPLEGVRLCDECIRIVEEEEGRLPSSADHHQRAERYRLWQAQHVLHLFVDSRGQLPTSVDEINEWWHEVGMRLLRYSSL